MRFKTSFLIGLSSILGAWFYYSENIISLTNVDILIKLLTVFLLIFLSSGSLNLFNDIIDLKIDTELKPERILPQGSVSIRKAYLFFIILVGTCFILSFRLNIIIFVIYFIMLGIGIGYSVFLQNIPLVKNFVVALSISMSILVGYLSLLINLEFVLSGTIIIIFILSLLSIFSFELQKDINDLEIDKKFNKNTFPVIFGKKRSCKLIYSIDWILLIIFWLYLAFVNSNMNIYLLCLLIIVQLYLLFSIRNIITDQSFTVLERARIRIYVLFAVTLFFLFFLK